MHPPLRLSLVPAVLAALAGAPAVAQTCGSWQVVASPNPAPGTYNALYAVSAVSRSEAWAVGSHLAAAPDTPMVFRWDGNTWSDVALPPLPLTTFGTLIDVQDVAAFAGGTMWTAGVASGRVLTLRWMNEAWETVSRFELRPQTVWPFGLRTATTEAIAGVSPDDVWIVGRASGFGAGGLSITPMTLHWDGSSWTEIDPPWVVDDVIWLEDVVALASDDVWAVGWGRGSSIPNRAIVYHWNGRAWRHVRTPAFAIYQSKLTAIDAVGPNDIWAVGSRPGGALLMHWDGTEWSVSPSPVVQTTSVGAVAAIASDDVWAIATLRDSFLHWNGTTWAEVVPPAVPGARSVHRADLAAVGRCDVWSVGDQSDGSTFGSGWLTKTPLIERLRDPLAAACRFRNGAGVNSVGFDCATPPVLGTTWASTIATIPGTLVTSVGIALGPSQVPFAGGELLIALSPHPVFVHGVGAHRISVPGTSSLLGARLSSQGFRFDMVGSTPTLVLLNAQDLTLGR